MRLDRESRRAVAQFLNGIAVAVIGIGTITPILAGNRRGRYSRRCSRVLAYALWPCGQSEAIEVSCDIARWGLATWPAQGNEQGPRHRKSWHTLAKLRRAGWLASLAIHQIAREPPRRFRDLPA